ncbi:MAG TPA: head GIN domain-containing protein [Chitinophagaceae bacterium]|nr:head GIN domain-containing protein [Chitinophagaceae bacterium]
MRKMFFPVALALFTSGAVLAQNDRPKIEGSGNLIIREFPVSSFDELNAAGVFHLQLSQGAREQVKIEAEDNLMDLFEVKNEGGALEIRMKKDVSFNSKKKMKVYVTFRSLKKLTLAMVGGTSSDEELNFSDLKFHNRSVGSVDLSLKLKSLDLENQSVGSVRLRGSADKAVIRTNSVGSIQAGDFVVQSMEVDNNGVGSATVNAEKALKVKDSFLGKVHNKGKATVKKTTRQVI